MCVFQETTLTHTHTRTHAHTGTCNKRIEVGVLYFNSTHLYSIKEYEVSALKGRILQIYSVLSFILDTIFICWCHSDIVLFLSHWKELNSYTQTQRTCSVVKCRDISLYQYICSYIYVAIVACVPMYRYERIPAHLCTCGIILHLSHSSLCSW